MNPWGWTRVVLLMVPVLSGCGTSPSDGYRELRDSSLGISCRYPAAWTVRKTPGKLGLFSPGEKIMLVFTSFSNIPPGIPAGEVFENVVVVPYRRAFSIGPNLLAPGRQPVAAAHLQQVNADRGYKGKFEGMIDGRATVFSIGLFIKGTTGYQIFGAIARDDFAIYSAMMIRVMDSFRIK